MVNCDISLYVVGRLASLRGIIESNSDSKGVHDFSSLGIFGHLLIYYNDVRNRKVSFIIGLHIYVPCEGRPNSGSNVLKLNPSRFE